MNGGCLQTCPTHSVPRDITQVVEVCAHRVNLCWRNITGEVTDDQLEQEGEERAKMMINEGYICGELNHYTGDTSANGWWEIQR